jgi:hypothetical protein
MAWSNLQLVRMSEHLLSAARFSSVLHQRFLKPPDAVQAGYVGSTDSVTVYEVETSRVPHVMSWCSSLISMSTFYPNQHQRYVMYIDSDYGPTKGDHNSTTEQEQYTSYF